VGSAQTHLVWRLACMADPVFSTEPRRSPRIVAARCNLQQAPIKRLLPRGHSGAAGEPPEIQKEVPEEDTATKVKDCPSRREVVTKAIESPLRRSPREFSATRARDERVSSTAVAKVKDFKAETASALERSVQESGDETLSTTPAPAPAKAKAKQTSADAKKVPQAKVQPSAYPVDKQRRSPEDELVDRELGPVRARGVQPKAKAKGQAWTQTARGPVRRASSQSASREPETGMDSMEINLQNVRPYPSLRRKQTIEADPISKEIDPATLVTPPDSPVWSPADKQRQGSDEVSKASSVVDKPRGKQKSRTSEPISKEIDPNMLATPVRKGQKRPSVPKAKAGAKVVDVEKTVSQSDSRKRPAEVTSQEVPDVSAPPRCTPPPTQGSGRRVSTETVSREIDLVTLASPPRGRKRVSSEAGLEKPPAAQAVRRLSGSLRREGVGKNAAPPQILPPTTATSAQVQNAERELQRERLKNERIQEERIQELHAANLQLYDRVKSAEAFVMDLEQRNKGLESRIDFLVVELVSLVNEACENSKLLDGGKGRDHRRLLRTRVERAISGRVDIERREFEERRRVDLALVALEVTSDEETLRPADPVDQLTDVQPAMVADDVVDASHPPQEESFRGLSCPSGAGHSRLAQGGAPTECVVQQVRRTCW